MVFFLCIVLVLTVVIGLLLGWWEGDPDDNEDAVFRGRRPRSFGSRRPPKGGP